MLMLVVSRAAGVALRAGPGKTLSHSDVVLQVHATPLVPPPPHQTEDIHAPPAVPPRSSPRARLGVGAAVVLDREPASGPTLQRIGPPHRDL